MQKLSDAHQDAVGKGSPQGLHMCGLTGYVVDVRCRVTLPPSDHPGGWCLLLQAARRRSSDTSVYLYSRTPGGPKKVLHEAPYSGLRGVGSPEELDDLKYDRLIMIARISVGGSWRLLCTKHASLAASCRFSTTYSACDSMVWQVNSS